MIQFSIHQRTFSAQLQIIVQRVLHGKREHFTHTPLIEIETSSKLAYGKLDSKAEPRGFPGVIIMDNKRRLIYIEDESEMIDLVRLILNRKGYEVIGANGGREGIDLVRRMLPDLVLLDLMMPDVDGWDVYQQMKADPSTQNIPVIVITAKAQNIDKILGLHIARVEDYISKPFSPQELLDSIDKVLTKQEEVKKEN